LDRDTHIFRAKIAASGQESGVAVGYWPRAVVVKSIIVAGMIAAIFPSLGATAQDRDAPVTNNQGQAIFSGRCGQCHDADGSKKLADGTTLLERLAKNKDPETRLATRLKDEQERHQVFLYLQPMIERERSTVKKAP
jgi:mono/diheme cytochrome c family protein